MWRSLFHLLIRSANTSFGYFSTNMLAVVVAVAAFLFPHARLWTMEGRKEMLKHVLRDIGLGGALVLVVYLCAFVWATIHIIYKDHQTLAVENERLTDSTKTLSAELEWRKHNISTTDPVFPNVIYLLEAFHVYRHQRKDEPCVLRVTASPDSLPLASAVAQFSNSVSGCFTFGPDPAGDPDVDKAALDGAIPGMVVFHADRDDKAADALFTNLGNQIQLRRSYDPLPQAILNFSVPATGRVRVIWLQFGAGVTWNSQLLSGKK